jgi:hypothetical protein
VIVEQINSVVELGLAVSGLPALPVVRVRGPLVGPPALAPADDQVPLKLRERQHDMKYQTANVGVLDQAHVQDMDTDAGAHPANDQVVGFRLGSGYPVQLADDDRIPGLDLAAQAVKLRAVHAGPRIDILIDHLASLGLKDGPLISQRRTLALLLRADPDIAPFHAQILPSLLTITSDYAGTPENRPFFFPSPL